MANLLAIEHLFEVNMFDGLLSRPEDLMMLMGLSLDDMITLRDRLINQREQGNYDKTLYNDLDTQVEPDDQHQTFRHPDSSEQSKPSGWDCRSANGDFRSVEDDCLSTYSLEEEAYEQLVMRGVRLLYSPEDLENLEDEPEPSTENLDEHTGIGELRDVKTHERNDEIVRIVATHPPGVNSDEDISPVNVDSPEVNHKEVNVPILRHTPKTRANIKATREEFNKGIGTMVTSLNRKESKRRLMFQEVNQEIIMAQATTVDPKVNEPLTQSQLATSTSTSSQSTTPTKPLGHLIHPHHFATKVWSQSHLSLS